MSHTLVLSPDYQPVSFLPLSTINWQTAIKLFFLDKVTVIEWYDDWTIKSTNLTIRVPAVIVTKSSFGMNRRYKSQMRFSRANLYLRDLYTCQYCNEPFNCNDLTIDHVYPQSLGGETSWENCVTACFDCNTRKGSKLLKPTRKPFTPDYWMLVKQVKQTQLTIKHESWYQYLGINKTNKYA